MPTCRSVVMSTFKPRAMPDNLARLHVLEATIEILKTENEILKRRLAAAETWAAQAVITKRLDLTAECARPWWRRLAGVGGTGCLCLTQWNSGRPPCLKS
jgi:hypothetical protein